jgi:hypothetical protein
LQSVAGGKFQLFGPTDVKMFQLIKRDGTNVPTGFDQQMAVSDVPQLAHFPPANAARPPLKDKN